MLAGDSSTYVYSTGTINGSTYAVFSPSSITINDSLGNVYEFTSDQSGNNALAYTYTDSQTTIPTSLESGFTFTTYNMVATNNQISTSVSASPSGLGISGCCIPSSFSVNILNEYFNNNVGELITLSNQNYDNIVFPSPSGSTINPTSCAYADGDTVYIGPGFVFGGNNIMFYSLNPWGDPTNTTVNSLPYSLGSSNTNSTTGSVFTSNANQYFGNQFSLMGSTGTNILFVPYTDSSLQKLGAIKFFLYSPFTTDSYIYNESGPTGNIKLSTEPTVPVTFPYSAYAGYLYAYYDPLNIDIAKTPSEFNEVALPTGYTPFMFDSQNFPSSNGSCPSGDFCFQTWSATNNVSTNVPSDYYVSPTTMNNPLTGTNYQLFGAVPISFASANTNLTYSTLNSSGNVENFMSTTTTLELNGTTVNAEGQYLGTSTYSYTSGTDQSAILGGTQFCSGTLIVGSYVNTSSTLSTFFGKSNLTTDQQGL